MRRFYSYLMVIFLLTAFCQSTWAGTYTLLSGETRTGEPIGFNNSSVMFRGTDGSMLDRVSYSQFTQNSLKQLKADAKNPKDAAFVDPFIEEVIQQMAKRKEIVVKEVTRLERPVRPGLLGLFGSPVGWVLILAFYGANLYAAYEVALFRRQPAPLVCGVAAVAPLVGPIIFLALPTRDFSGRNAPVEAASEEVAVEVLDDAATGADAMVHSDSNIIGGDSAPALPEPTVYARSDFNFNRRFFETKLSGFLRVVPGDEEKDLVIAIRSARGSYVGRRLTSITQSEVHLQTFKGDVTADVMIPFNEIQEVTVKHKDLA